MFSELHGLRVDYVNQQGHYMVLSKESGLSRDELSTFQLNMLLANRIPHVLELQVEELNQRIKLFYNITDKRMLSHWLRMRSLTMKQFYHLLYSVADAISECGVYMLQEQRYVIQEDYIYCGNDFTDIYITYIPMELADKHPIPVQLQHLASRLVHKVTELTGGGYQELMNYLMEESFNLSTLKQLLLRHMNATGGDNPGNSLLRDYSSHSENHVEHSWMRDDSALIHTTAPSVRQDTIPRAASDWSTAVPAVNDRNPAEEGRPLFGQQLPENTLSSIGEEEAGGKPAKNIKLPMMLIGILGICLSWKLYLDHPSEGWLYISAGLSLLTADFVFVVLWIWKRPEPKGMEYDERETASQPAPNNPSPDAILARLSMQKPVEPSSSLASFLMRDTPKETETRSDTFTQEQPASVESITGHDSNSYYHALDQRTTLLSHSDATVLLSATTLKEKAEVPFLEVVDSGGLRKINLEKPVFVIGRGGKGVDYEHKETGASRLHAEIVQQNGSYGVKDLGSRNGTRVNGEWLAPYKVYALNEGDKVTIVSTDFTFKMGL